MYSPDVKKCAQQIVKESFTDILIGEFQMPSQDQIESYLFQNIDYGFDEYQVKKRFSVHTFNGVRIGLMMN